MVMPGLLAIKSPKFSRADSRDDLMRFCRDVVCPTDSGVAMITLVDESDFAARNLKNWLWVTFTRSNPAVDLDGIAGGTVDKHWGCRGAVVIDARIKPHHAPPLVEDRETLAKVDARAARGGVLAKYL
jgi:4-hydroxy-3-polyprenylbenzoate decarboxylase